MTNYDDITAACADYDIAAQKYDDCIDEKYRVIHAVTKHFDNLAYDLEENRTSVMDRKHTLIAQAIADNPRWYEDEQLRDRVIDCVYIEEADAHFFIKNDFPVTHVVNTHFSEICAGLTHYAYTSCWDDEDGKNIQFITPTIYIPADTADEKLEQLATNLDDYLVSVSQRVWSIDTTCPIYVPIDKYNGDRFVSTEQGLYFLGSNKYVVSSEPFSDEEYELKEKDSMPLLDVLKEVRQNYGEN